MATPLSKYMSAGFWRKRQFSINEGEIYRFFTKPCNIVDLKVSIRQALEQKKLVEENRRLSKLVKSQAASLNVLEAQCPGITEVKRDVGGDDYY